MKHHTKTKGDLGVLKAQCDLYEKGYDILIPLTEHAPFDLVIHKNGEFDRVQVKYISLENENTIRLKIGSSWSDKKGKHFKLYNRNDLDIFCIYCPNTNKCYYIRFEDIDVEKQISFRLNEKHYRNQFTTRLLSDYENIKPKNASVSPVTSNHLKG